jgi:predicted dienelactone hydrolase
VPVTLPDDLFLILIAALAGWRVVVPGFGRSRAGISIALAAAAALLHLAIAGFTWQALTGWALIGAAALERWLHRRPGWWTRAGFAVMGAAALAPWAVLPQVALPAPDGPFAVASMVMRWTDPVRPESATAEPADRRAVIVQAWLPRTDADGAAPPYLDGLGRLPPRVIGVPRFILHRWDRIRTASAGRLAQRSHAWPVILFSPGFGAPRAAYSGLARQLASRGYAVLAVDHPYEAALTQLPDGRLAQTQALPGHTDAEIIASMDRQAQVRADDLRFVLSRLAQPGALPAALAERLDLSRLAAAGHSFGGAAAVLASQEDARIGAAIDIDGTLYAGASGSAAPMLIVESGAETPRGDRYRQGAARMLARGARRIVLAHSNHYSFTDAEFALAPPARWLLHGLIGGGRGAGATQRDTAIAIDDFLQRAWRRPASRPGPV